MANTIGGQTDRSPTVEEIEAEAEKKRMATLEDEFYKNKDNIGSGDGTSGKEGFHRCYNRTCDDYRKDLLIGVDCQCGKSRKNSPGHFSSQVF